jgi:Trk K+ transport system NAD-binding subunit
MTPVETARSGAELQDLGVECLAGSSAWDVELLRQDLGTVACIVLAGDNDSQNVDVCLRVRQLDGQVPVLVRVSDQTLVRFLRMSVPHVDVYSMGSTTAPVAADLAMQLASRRTAPRPEVQRPVPTVVRGRTVLLAVLAATGVLLVVLGAILAAALKLRGVDALAAVASAMLSGQVASDAQLAKSLRWLPLLMAALDRVALVCAMGLVVDWLLPRRLPGAVPAEAVRLHDHVVVMGAGNVGARVAELLHQRQVPVVVVESAGQLRNVQRLRSLGVPVIVGDATVEETLDLAAAWRASVVLALTNSDAVNLHVGLQLADRKIGVPTVVRLLSPELARSVADSEDVSVLSPVAETASHVCRAAERLRTERLRKLDKAPVRDETTGLDYLPDTGEHRAHGRFAGPEFDAAAPRPVTGTTDQHLRPGRTPSSPTVDAMPSKEESP